MPVFTTLSRERHAHQGWKRHEHYTFAAAEAVVPLVGMELPGAAPAMPVAFIPAGTGYQLVGVLSLQPGSNLFVGPNGQWLGAYVPAIWRSYPFRVLLAEGSGQAVLCIDETSELVVDASAADAVFFDAQGAPSATVREVLDWLSQVENSRIVTQEAVDALAGAGVIQPWPLQVERAGQKLSVAGLHCVNEAALNALDDAAYLELRRRQSLPVAYAQLLSMRQIAALERLSQVQARFAERRRLQPPSAARVAGGVVDFGLTPDDQILRFD